jgi:hypothetical protein
VRPIILNCHYTIRLEDDSTHEIRVIEFTEKGVICSFVREWIAKQVEITYSIFELNGLKKDHNYV